MKKLILLTLVAEERMAIWQEPEQNGFRIKIANDTALCHHMREEYAAHDGTVGAFYLDYANKIQACEENMESMGINGFIDTTPQVQIYANNMDMVLDWIENKPLENERINLLNQLIALYYLEMVDENFNPAGIRNSL